MAAFNVERITHVHHWNDTFSVLKLHATLAYVLKMVSL
jgi:hypothetical protein